MSAAPHVTMRVTIETTRAESFVACSLVAAVKSIADMAMDANRDVGQSEGVTVEFEIANTGEVIDSRACVERRGIQRTTIRRTTP
jgi:hypothetical protein